MHFFFAEHVLKQRSPFTPSVSPSDPTEVGRIHIKATKIYYTGDSSGHEVAEEKSAITLACSKAVEDRTIYCMCLCLCCPLLVEFNAVMEYNNRPLDHYTTG